MNASSPSTFDNYRALAVERPMKARRYERSIRETLVAGVGPCEAARLREALEGIAAGLAAHGPVCERCGRSVDSDEAKATGLGSHCRRKAS